MTEPRIYIANLAQYNAGKLVGRWVDLTPEVQDIHDAIAEICPGDDEWAIHDSEGLPRLLKGENPNLDDLATFASLCEDHDAELVIAAIENFSDLSEAETALTEHYAGTYRDLGTFAESLAEDCGDLRGIPEPYRRYIDFDAMGRDMELSGDVWTAETSEGVAVFWNR